MTPDQRRPPSRVIEPPATVAASERVAEVDARAAGRAGGVRRRAT